MRNLNIYKKVFARRLRKNQTDAERRLWLQLCSRRLSGFKFRRQHPIGPYVVDFVCLEKKLVIELDGGQHIDRIVDDNRRTEFLRRHGFKVMRFWDNEFLKETTSVLDAIYNELNKSPSPVPFSQRERVRLNRKRDSHLALSPPSGGERWSEGEV